MRFTIFDRWGNQIGVLQDIVEAVWKDELNGEDSLTIVTTIPQLHKGDRLVWRDKWGTWHEHIANEPKDVHANDGTVYSSVYCENSITELFCDFLDDVRCYDYTATAALTKALSTSRWEAGMINVTNIASANFYHVSAREAVADIVNEWGCEYLTTIEVAGADVVARKVNLLKQRGSDLGKRFTFDKDLTSIERTVGEADVYTALYGYGKGLESYDDDGNLTGGYNRKLTFGSINAGRDYVTNETAKEKWGLPDGKGGIKHAFGKVEFSNCDDAYELLRLTREELKKLSQPLVSYKATVIDLADAGFDCEDVRTGDVVAIIDRDLDERLEGRVLCTERRLLEDTATVITLGSIRRNASSIISQTASDLNKIKDHTSAWDDAASLQGGYVDAVIDSLNKTMNSTGGYIYMEPGEGITCYDKPKDQNPTMAVQIGGAGFRIANSKLSNGEWNWRTFGTGDGFTADCINAGVIKGGSNYWNLEDGTMLFKQGIITDVDGKTQWNLSTGNFTGNDIVIRNADISGTIRTNDPLDTFWDNTIVIDENTIGFYDKRHPPNQYGKYQAQIVGSSGTISIESESSIGIYANNNINIGNFAAGKSTDRINLCSNSLYVSSNGLGGYGINGSYNGIYFINGIATSAS